MLGQASGLRAERVNHGTAKWIGIRAASTVPELLIGGRGLSCGRGNDGLLRCRGGDRSSLIQPRVPRMSKISLEFVPTS